MAKSKKAKAKPAPPPVHLPPSMPLAPPTLSARLVLGYDPTGRMDPRDIVKTKEGWSEYTLSDGSVIRAKSVVLDVKRAVNQFNVEGDPVYVMQITMVHNLIAPKSLKQKKKKA